MCVAALAILVACTGDAGSHDSEGASPSASSAAAGAASADVAVHGDAALVAAFAQPDVRCNFPDVNGPSIALLSAPPDLVFRVKVQEGNVTVLVTDSATPTPHERDFTGSGVTSFGAGTGAQVDSTLTEVPTASGSAGGIGQLTAIKASIDCAGQDPGTSTVTLTGDTPQGPLTNAVLETARVECYPPANEVSVVGIVTLAGTKVFVDLGLRPDSVSVNKAVEGGNFNYVSPPGAATVTDTGAQVDGDAIEQSGTASHVLHVQGDATCGTPVS